MHTIYYRGHWLRVSTATSFYILFSPLKKTLDYQNKTQERLRALRGVEDQVPLLHHLAHRSGCSQSGARSVVARNNDILKQLVLEAKREYEKDAEHRVHIYMADT